MIFREPPARLHVRHPIRLGHDLIVAINAQIDAFEPQPSLMRVATTCPLGDSHDINPVTRYCRRCGHDEYRYEWRE